MPAAVALRGERRDDVVGLEALGLQRRDRQRASTSRIRSTWPRKSVGVSVRVAL